MPAVTVTRLLLPTITGDHDIATVLDPSATLGSFANAGASQGPDGVSVNYDVASVVFSDDVAADAQGVNDLYDIIGAG